MQKQNELKETIKELVTQLVDAPDNIEILMSAGFQHTTYEIKVEKTDVGKVLGRSGKNINAIRQIAQSIAAKNRFFASVEVLDV